MKKHKDKSKLIIVGSIIIISAVLTQLLFSAFAASNSLSLTSNKQSLKSGELVTVSINASTDEEITIAEANVTYDPSKLQFMERKFNGSPLTNDSPESYVKSGVVNISRYKAGTPYPRGGIFVGQIIFKALKSSGSTDIGINQSQSALWSANAENVRNILGSVSGTSVTFTSTTTGGGSSGGGSTGDTGSGSTGGQGAATSGSSSTSGSGNSGASATTGTSQDGSAEKQKFESFAAIGEENPNLPNPGKSQLGNQQSFFQRVFSFLGSIAPIAGVLAVFSVVVFILAKRINNHPHGFDPQTHIAANTGPAGPGSGVLIGTNNQKNNK